jgi:hypothetical protein
MRSSIRRLLVTGLVAGAVLVGGCLPEQLIDAGNPLAAFVVVLSYSKAKSSPAKAPKPIKGHLDVALTGSIGGLTGDYTIGFGTYGQFTGTGKIGHDRRSATVTAVDSQALRDMVHGIVLDATAVDLTVTQASAKVTGRQTTGGVKKSWNGTIKFQGTVNSGGIVGRTVKGTLKSKGHL